MNKKQAVIIVTLLVLIVCAGVLATKVNSPLYVNDTSFDSDNKSAVSLNNDNLNDATSKTEVFSEMRLTRDQSDAKTIQTLKSLIDDPNVSKENKDTATKKSISITTAAAKASKIESQLKTKGFVDSVCFVEEDNVKVVVKSDTDKLTEQQQREIKDIVIATTQIKNIKIEVKH